MNIKNLRFREMDATSTFMGQEAAKLNDLLRPLRLFDDGDELEKYCLGYLQKKVSSKPLRAYYARKLYEYLSYYPEYSEVFQALPNSGALFLRKLPFVFELVITIQYLHNHILDEKYDVKRNNHPKIVQNLISSNVLRELLFQYVELEVVPLLPNRGTAGILTQNLRRLLLWVDIGQYVDKEYNHYNRWKQELPPSASPPPFFDEIVHRAIDDIMNQVKADVPDKSAFIEAYFQRIYLSNVYFFRCMAETLMALGNYRGEQYEPLLIFSTQYGFMLQIINDYADFAYSENKKEQNILKTAGKKTTDILADLNNFNITLPLIYHLKNGYRRKIEAFLEQGLRDKKILVQYPKQIKQEIVQSGSIQESILKSIELSKYAKSFLDEKNPQSAFFANMCDMAIDNKFYQIFK